MAAEHIYSRQGYITWLGSKISQGYEPQPQSAPAGQPPAEQV
jgi:hypothetical protein